MHGRDRRGAVLPPFGSNVIWCNPRLFRLFVDGLDRLRFHQKTKKVRMYGLNFGGFVGYKLVGLYVLVFALPMGL